MSTTLPSEPTADDFRALARSSPWRFTRLHWSHRQTGSDVPADRGGSVEAWLDRTTPQLTVRSARGVEVEQGVPYSTSFLSSDTDDVSTGPHPPRDEGVLLRADGLVAVRPQGWAYEHGDPMWRDYQWTAMLDPAELADGCDPAENGPPPAPPGVDVVDVRSVDLRGRPTWQATCSPLVGVYDPRCGCCPLLDGEASRLAEYGPDDPNLAVDSASLPTAYLVSLDVETGIVVDVSPLDGSGGSSLVNEIYAVDEPLRPPT